MKKRAITLLLAAPRGFCAGVDRAIQIVELALERYGKPIYVRHEIVHNRYVVEGLEQRGAVFVDEEADSLVGTLTRETVETSCPSVGVLAQADREGVVGVGGAPLGHAH